MVLSLPSMFPSYAVGCRPFRGPGAASWKWAREELKCKLASSQYAGFKNLVSWMTSHSAGETGTELPKVVEQHVSRAPRMLTFFNQHLENCPNAIILNIQKCVQKCWHWSKF